MGAVAICSLHREWGQRFFLWQTVLRGSWSYYPPLTQGLTREAANSLVPPKVSYQHLPRHRQRRDLRSHLALTPPGKTLPSRCGIRAAS